ncbi:LacI family DNA-binding transcriptional regulator [Vagococcus vulneris]|uniref:HTH lacI-type domain-containing protein n=1 Tax=Vagococcus vulneris TaxID=1977869 RepID=A0A429ZYM8_9ENTE|nr:LacI family DNA-binding transcriptional regulator [Vagococcus vulneris]RST99089.1 hypothetical protein CBF37_05335 [Vagococcus vulneris]
MAGIRDVAKLANVSIATVSRFLNEDPNLSIQEDTKKRILDSASKLNYVHKKINRSVANITLILTVSEHDELNDPYFRLIKQGVIDEANRLKIKISQIVRLTGEISRISLEKVDGVILIGQVQQGFLSYLLSVTPNLVVVDDETPNMNYDVVYPDLGNIMINYLDSFYAHGYRNIFYIGGKRLLKNYQNDVIIEESDIRESTYQDWMTAHQLDSHCYIGDWSIFDGMRLADELLKDVNEIKSPTVVIVGSDPMAVGVYRSFQKHGILIPEQVSIVSFDNIEVAEFLTPPLTTNHIETEELGKISIRLIKERIDNIRSTPVRVSISGELITRESENIFK